MNPPDETNPSAGEPTIDALRDPTTVEGLAEDFLERRRRGEKPTVHEYVQRHPQLADEILAFFPALGLVEEFKPGSNDATGSFAAGAAIPTLGRPLDRLGDYRILREIGRGGMGVVYEAEQESLGRRVALKVVTESRLADARLLARFGREARAAARLHHTNIVPVFGFGEVDGVHYYVMQFIQGQGLDAVLDEVRRLERVGKAPSEPIPTLRADVSAADMARSLMTGRFEPATNEASDPGPTATAASSSTTATLPRASGYAASVARIGLQAAEAMAYAHDQGILHRDIKPSNLLLDAHGIVWITDFGLAKTTNDEDLTHTGDILGTLRYMAPERFQGHCDARADIYALGLTLYELLARRPAFDERDRARLIRQVTEGTPPPLRKLDRSIPRDLATVVHKAIERDPGHRYRTARAFADDLRRCLEDQPIAARRITTTERAWRWCRRNPLPAVLGSLFIFSLLGGLAFSTFLMFRLQAVAQQNSRLYYREVDRSKQLAEATEQARVGTELANRRLYDVRMNVAQRSWEDWDGAGFHQALDEQLPENQGGIDRRGWEWHYWDRKIRSGRRDLDGLAGSYLHLAMTQDASRIAAADEEGTVRVWDAASGRQLATMPGHGERIVSLAISPDGSRIASDNLDEPVCRIWNTETGELQLLLWDPSKCRLPGFFNLTFSPDGSRIASWESSTILVWDGQTGQLALELEQNGQSNAAVAFSPDGSRLAVARWRDGVRILDARSGQELHHLRDVDEGYSLTFSPDGSRIAVGCIDGTVRLWDTSRGREDLRLQGHKTAVMSMAFSADGSRIVTASWDGTVRAWDAATGRGMFVFRGPEKCQWESAKVAFRPDGSRIAAVGGDGSFWMWDADEGQEDLFLRGHTEPIQRVLFSPDGSRIASGDRKGVIRFWDAASGQAIQELKYYNNGIFDLAFSPDGKRLAAAAGTQEVPVWDPATGQEFTNGPWYNHTVEIITYKENGITCVVDSHTDHTIRVHNVDSARELLMLAGPIILAGHINWRPTAAFSPDGSRIVVTDAAPMPRVWDLSSGEPIQSLAGNHDESERISCFAFSPDGSRIAAGTHDNLVKVWDSRTGRNLFTLRGHTASVESVAFSPDGQRLASGGEDMTVRLWDTTTGQEVLTLRGHTGGVNSVAFSPDGERLASGGDDMLVRVWDARAPSPKSLAQDEARAWITSILGLASSLPDLRDRLAGDRTRSTEVRAAAQEMAPAFWTARSRLRAEEIVEWLFQRLILRDRVLASLRSGPTIDPILREACLKRAGSRPDEPSAGELNDGSWQFVRYPGRPAAEYRRGLDMALVACGIEPDNWAYLNTLGVARYRTGLIAEALATLARTNAMSQEKEPTDLAFLAMAHMKLGQDAEARARLEQLRIAVERRQDQVEPDQAAEDRAILSEAEAVVLSDPAFPEDPFEP